MINQGAELSVSRQCEILDLNRTGVYYTPRPVPAEDLILMRRIDELHLEHPFYGARRLAKQLTRDGFEVGRVHVTTLMRRMGIEALYRRPRTSIAARGSLIYPYLLDGLAIERPNQVWASDLTYLPMAHGFLYLVAILDVASRKVLSFRVSNTMTPDFCVEALTEAIARYGAPEIVNTDQGSQFTSKAWTDVLDAAGVRMSMDGKGRWIDNVFIERLWRLCAQGRYVAGSAGCSGFTVDVRTMRAHNEGAPSVRRKWFGSLKDDCRKRRTAGPRGQRACAGGPKCYREPNQSSNDALPRHAAGPVWRPPAPGISHNRTASAFMRMVISAYRFVVERFVWPSHPRMTLTSTPASNRCTAAVRRNTCGET